MTETEKEAVERRRREHAFKMRHARRRYRAEVAARVARCSLREWCRKTYNPHACAYKLAEIVAR